MQKSVIPQGNTVQGVNLRILEHLKATRPLLQSAFDLPCGQGEFLLALQTQFSNAEVLGQDLYAQALPQLKSQIFKADAKDWSRIQNKKFELITCISGVMAFDDLTGFFNKAADHLSANGSFIVTNDNVMSLRDRLHFLFFGRVKRFQLLYTKNEGNWNLVLPQAIWKLGNNAGFTLEKVEYLTPKIEDWLMAPLGLVFYIFQLLALMKKSEMSWKEKFQLFPPQMMWMRHMIFYFKKNQ